ncbi:hypothetical protein TNCV_312441 [Trichonephila clavipes]|nr:hypothetical protein TNCV_312441 [Trichonephila clavipes]
MLPRFGYLCKLLSFWVLTRRIDRYPPTELPAIHFSTGELDRWVIRMIRDICPQIWNVIYWKEISITLPSWTSTDTSSLCEFEVGRLKKTIRFHLSDTRYNALGITANAPGDMQCDEAHFWLNGYVNKQNCRIWSEANPQVYVETPLHPEKLTVWCALWAGGILLQKR